MDNENDKLVNEDEKSVNHQSIDAIVKCGICENYLETPKYTRCKHTFCKDCITEWIENDNKLCPTCGKPICLTDLKKAPKEIRTMLRQVNFAYRGQDATKRKKRALKKQTTETSSQIITNCPAASVNCSWKGFEDQFAVHLERCPYNIAQPILEDVMQHNDHLMKQMNQYKNRIKILENEALEMNKKIMDLEELCNDYKEQIEQLKHQKQGMTPYRNIELQNIIEKCQSRSTVDLKAKRLKDQDMEIVVDEAMDKKQCKRLLLDQNKISLEGVTILADGLKTNVILETLNLENNSIGDQGVKILCDVLSTINWTLKRLDLNKNNITSIGVQYLAKMLKTNSSLIWLELHTNNIGDRGIEVLADTLSYDNKTLEVLDLCFNKSITDKCAESLIKMVQHNRALRRFHMFSCNLSGVTRDQIRLTATSDTILRQLEI